MDAIAFIEQQQAHAAAINAITHREALPSWLYTDFHWYHGQIQYLSNSMLGKFRDQPEKFAGLYVDRNIRPKETKYLYEGRVRHLALLEPSVFESQVVPVPVEVLTRKAITEAQKEEARAAGKKIKDIEPELNPHGQRRGKAWDDFEKEHTDRLNAQGLWPIFLKPEERQEIVDQRAAILADFRQFIEAPGAIESSIFWRCPITGAYLRCRPDKVIDLGDRWLVIDFKTAASTIVRKLYYSAKDFGYPYQHALYEDGLLVASDGKPVEFIFLACENSRPFCPLTFDFEPETVEAARARNYRDIERIEDCKATGDWVHPSRERVNRFTIATSHFERDLKSWT
jgi:hypothetical protein